MIQQSLQTRIHKARWSATLQGTNLRRTILVVAFYAYQQITGAFVGQGSLRVGQAFISTFQTVFYQRNGYAAHSFTYPVISACLSVIACLPCMWFTDVWGRRPMLLASFSGQAIFLCLLAGLGEKAHQTKADRGACVAFFMLFSVSYSVRLKACLSG